MQLDELLELTIHEGASDLHLHMLSGTSYEMGKHFNYRA